MYQYRGQDVAVKMLKVQDMPEEMLDEFDREVDLMNKLRHKNIGTYSRAYLTRPVLVLT